MQNNYEKQQVIDQVLETVQEIEQKTLKFDRNLGQILITRLVEEVKKMPDIERAIDRSYNRGFVVKELSASFGSVPRRSTVKIKNQRNRRYARKLLTCETSGVLFAVLVLP